MKKSFSFPIIFMIVISAVFTSILAFLNYSTADKIAFNNELELSQKMLYIFDIEEPSSDPNDIKKAFEDNIDNIGTAEDPLYVYKDASGEIVGYAVPVSGPGLWGSVNGFIGITADYSTVLGLDFISHSETPGLGGRISEDDYKDQFRGLDLTSASNGQYIVYRPAPGGNVDAIAGATLTSKAVAKFVNQDLDDFIKERRN